MEPQTGIEPAYSNYAVNDRLEGGGDTEAILCYTRYLAKNGTININDSNIGI